MVFQRLFMARARADWVLRYLPRILGNNSWWWASRVQRQKPCKGNRDTGRANRDG